MSSLQYFKPQNLIHGAPLCNSIASNAIAMANREVEKEIAKKKNKCGQYRKSGVYQ